MHHCYENRMEYLVVNQGASKKRLTARDGRTLRRCDQRTVVRAWFKGSGRLNLLRCHGRMMGRSGVAAKPPCVEIRNRVIYPVVGDAVGLCTAHMLSKQIECSKLQLCLRSSRMV
jgi:hypothetical protein